MWIVHDDYSIDNNVGSIVQTVWTDHPTVQCFVLYISLPGLVNVHDGVCLCLYTWAVGQESCK